MKRQDNLGFNLQTGNRNGGGAKRSDVFNAEERALWLERLGRELQAVTRAHAERGE